MIGFVRKLHIPLDKILGAFLRKALESVACVDLRPNLVVEFLFCSIMATYTPCSPLFNAAPSAGRAYDPCRGFLCRPDEFEIGASTASRLRTDNLVSRSFDPLWDAICQVNELVEQ